MGGFEGCCRVEVTVLDRAALHKRRVMLDEIYTFMGLV
jgi:hypothetical protein